MELFFVQVVVKGTMSSRSDVQVVEIVVKWDYVQFIQTEVK